MNIAWSTLAIVGLLIPGLSFYVGYTQLYRRFNESRPPFSLESILKIVGFNFLYIFVVVGLADKFCNPQASRCMDVYALGKFISGEWLADPQFLTNHVLGNAWSEILTFGIIFVLLVPLVLGLLIGTSYLTDFVWARPLLSKLTGSSIVRASVLTNVKHDSRVLAYSGNLSALRINSDGTIGSVLLHAPVKYFLFLRFDVPETSFDAAVRVGEKSFQNSDNSHPIDHNATTLLIEGEDIANVVWDSLELRPPKPSKWKRFRNWLVGFFGIGLEIRAFGLKITLESSVTEYLEEELKKLNSQLKDAKEGSGKEPPPADKKQPHPS